MQTFADTLTPQERKRARIYAYFACYSGCISEVMLDSSAIIILYIGMLGGSNMLIMLSTSFSGILGMLLMLPGAFIVSRVGMKKSVGIACTIGCCGFLIMALAPFFGSLQTIMVIAGCLIYCSQRSLYCAAWYPMLDAFLRPQDRGRFFGTMRYSYMIVSGVIFYLLGKSMGKNPPLALMQIIIAVTGLLVLGRWYCMAHFPENPAEQKSKLNIKQALGICLRNGPLVNYSVYSCLLSMAYTSLVPLTLVYLKSHVQLPPGQVQIFSTIGIAGSITGFFFYGKLFEKFKIKHLEIAVHCIFLFAALLLFFINKDIPGFIWYIGVIYFMAAYAASTFLCNNSTELLALARPGNKPMAMAFQQTYMNTGVSIGRTGTSLILGSHLLASQWQWGSMSFSCYQTLFLFYAVIAAVILILLPALPAICPKDRDYYQPLH